MKVKDLKIGNYIQGIYDSEEELWDTCQVVSLDSVGAAEYPIMVESEKSNFEYLFEFKPIEITIPWLLKLGFEEY